MYFEMNFLTRKAFLSGLDKANYELARQQLRQAGFDIEDILSSPIFSLSKDRVDAILTAIQPNNNQ
jgi:hypothetical protein